MSLGISSPKPRIVPKQPRLPERYVRVPTRLLRQASYDPLVVAIYALVGRLYLVTQEPVVLSAKDLTRYDPSLSRGAAERAFTRLVRDGYLVEQVAIGKKTRYLPTWGPVQNTPRPWSISAPCLDRPRHVKAIILDIRLFDVFIGKLTLHTVRAALVTRYVSAPLLTLADIGMYALAVGGIPVVNTTLARWGLLHGDRPSQIPDEAAILALASQSELHGQDISLTARGLQQLGAVPSQQNNSLQPLFFVPHEVIGSLIEELPNQVIDSQTPSQQGFSASQSGIVSAHNVNESITWESQETKTSQQPPTTPAKRGGGRRTYHNQHINLPDQPNVQLLRALNIRPDVIHELADVPEQAIHTAIAHGKAHANVRDLAGWVVALLRAHRRHGWNIELPRALADIQQDGWARLKAEYETSSDQHGDKLFGSQESHLIDACGSRTGGAASNGPCLSEAAVDTSTPSKPVGDVSRTLRESLRSRTPRSYWGLIDRLEACVGHECVLLRCYTKADYDTTYRELMPYLEAALSDIGLCGTARVTLAVAEAALPSASQDDLVHPAWISPQRWALLPALLRAALAGTYLVEGEIQGLGAHRQTMIQKCYVKIVQELLIEAQEARTPCR
jgi:hypothetical protein